MCMYSIYYHSCISHCRSALDFIFIGGSVQAGLAIFDTMQYIPCDVRTVCYGMAASMGAFLLSAGTKGKRKSLPNSRIMIHQPLGGAQGKSSAQQIFVRQGMDAIDFSFH